MVECVEYCQTNIDEPARDRLQELTSLVDVTALERPCLRRCGTCYSTSFFIVDGEAVCAATHDEVLEQLDDLIRTSSSPVDRSFSATLGGGEE